MSPDSYNMYSHAHACPHSHTHVYTTHTYQANSTQTDLSIFLFKIANSKTTFFARYIWYMFVCLLFCFSLALSLSLSLSLLLINLKWISTHTQHWTHRLNTYNRAHGNLVFICIVSWWSSHLLHIICSIVCCVTHAQVCLCVCTLHWRRYYRRRRFVVI